MVTLAPEVVFCSKNFKRWNTSAFVAVVPWCRRRGASLHASLRPVLVAAQVFALMPVDGLRRPAPDSLRFRWLSFRTAYSLMMAFGSALMVITHIMWLTETSFAFSNTSLGVFFMCHVLTSLLFVQLARGWPDLMAQWWAMDTTVPCFNPRLPKLFCAITCVLMLTALAEHVLARLFNVVHAYECSPGGLSWLQLYLANEFPSAYHYIGFTYWTSAWLATINTAATFSWNYMDLFLILISLALSDRFEHFNQTIARVFDKAVPQKTWQRIREDYCSLAHLAHCTNARVNKIVLLSFTTNLYFICYQLLNSLSLHPSMLEMVYRCWSFAYLVVRTCAVSLSAARVYEKSREPKRLLFLVHPKSYGAEVQRLLDQINSDEIALTGFNFFSITRTFMLTVAGTIVTYEIVLMQFNNVSNAQASTMANKTFCTFDYY